MILLFANAEALRFAQIVATADASAQVSCVSVHETVEVDDMVTPSPQSTVIVLEPVSGIVHSFFTISLFVSTAVAAYPLMPRIRGINRINFFNLLVRFS